MGDEARERSILLQSQMARAEGQAMADGSKIFTEMAINLRIGSQARQGVDEAKELNFQRFVTHGPTHRDIVEPRLSKGQRFSSTNASDSIRPNFGLSTCFAFSPDRENSTTKNNTTEAASITNVMGAMRKSRNKAANIRTNFQTTNRSRTVTWNLLLWA